MMHYKREIIFLIYAVQIVSSNIFPKDASVAYERYAGFQEHFWST